MVGELDVSAARKVLDRSQMPEPGAGTVDPYSSAQFGRDDPRVPGAHDALAGAAKAALVADMEDRTDRNGADRARKAADQLDAKSLRMILSEHVMTLLNGPGRATLSPWEPVSRASLSRPSPLYWLAISVTFGGIMDQSLAAYWPYAIGLLVLVVVLAVLKELPRGRTGNALVERKTLMTQPEKKFYRLLHAAYPDADIALQVAMGALLQPRRGLSRKAWFYARGQIA